MMKFAIATAILMAVPLTACGSASETAGSSSESAGLPSGTSTSGSPSTADRSSGVPTGSDAGSPYCAELRSAKAQFQDVNFQLLDDAQFRRLTASFDHLAATAPSDVKDDWTILSDALRRVRQLLANVGLSFDDLTSLSSGHLPAGVTVQRLKTLSQQFQHFSHDTRFQTAAAKIASHAKSECAIIMGS